MVHGMRTSTDRVTGKGFPLDDDLVPCLGGAVEAGHHHVDVGGERVHNDDLARGSADKGS